MPPKLGRLRRYQRPAAMTTTTPAMIRIRFFVMVSDRVSGLSIFPNERNLSHNADFKEFEGRVFEFHFNNIVPVLFHLNRSHLGFIIVVRTWRDYTHMPFCLNDFLFQSYFG